MRADLSDVAGRMFARTAFYLCQGSVQLMLFNQTAAPHEIEKRVDSHAESVDHPNRTQRTDASHLRGSDAFRWLTARTKGSHRVKRMVTNRAKFK